MTLPQIKAALKRHKIEKVKPGGADIDGILRGKYISMEKFLSAADSSFGFCDVTFGWDSSDVLYDNVRLAGWHTGYPDLQGRINLRTFRVIPWEANTAFFLADFYLPGGRPFPASPRYVLRRVTERAEKMVTRPASPLNTNTSFSARTRSRRVTSIAAKWFPFHPECSDTAYCAHPCTRISCTIS
jgi:glutamine synthetase